MPDQPAIAAATPRQESTPTQHHIVVERHGGPEVLVFKAGAMPHPEIGEVRIKVIAAGVSGYDAMIRGARWLPGARRLPFVPGLDVVGTIEALGPGSSNFEIGQMVAGSTIWRQGGGYAEFINLPTTEIVAVPDMVDPCEAVCLVTNYLTAHLALHGTAKIERGEQVLIHGAAGGVGSALVELGRLADVDMYGTASEQNLDLVNTLGATPIDYRNEDFVERIRRYTGDGVDAVFDPIGGARQLVRSYRALRQGGRLIWFGVAASSRHGLRIIPSSLVTAFALKILPDGKHAPFMEDMGKFGQAHGDWYRDTLTSLLEELAAGRLKPAIAEWLPLSQARRAHELLAQGSVAGKIVLMPDQSAP